MVNFCTALSVRRQSATAITGCHSHHLAKIRGDAGGWRSGLNAPAHVGVEAPAHPPLPRTRPEQPRTCRPRFALSSADGC